MCLLIIQVFPDFVDSRPISPMAGSQSWATPLTNPADGPLLLSEDLMGKNFGDPIEPDDTP
jgi:hypothetical protein